MQLDLSKDWSSIVAYVDKAMKSSRYVSVATVDAEGRPTVTPIGSLILNGDPSGYFLERFPRRIGENAEHNPNFCVLAENTNLFQILRQTRGGGGYFGVKLYGRLGDRRPADEAEIARMAARIRIRRSERLQGMLFGSDIPHLREFTVDAAEALLFAVDKGKRRFVVG